MHKLNNFIDVFNKNTCNKFDLYRIWLTFVDKSSSKIPKTKYRFVMEPTVLPSNANRMALTYLSQCAVFHNIEAVKQYWKENDASNSAFLDFIHVEREVMYIATLSILISEVC